MSTLYVISNETNEVVATITGNDDESHKKYMSEYGSNDYTYSFTDFGLEYVEEVNEIELPYKDHTRNARQRKRRQKLNEIAKSYGYKSWSVLETKIINQEIEYHFQKNTE